jgi:hypothetical protein
MIEPKQFAGRTMVHQQSMINGKVSDFAMASGTIDLTQIVQHISIHSSNSVRGNF